MENNGVCGKNYKCFLTGLIQYGTSLGVHIGSGVVLMRKCWLELLTNRVECRVKTIERKVLIFDPGGTLNKESICDLEDKVDFKGWVIIHILIYHQGMKTVTYNLK